MKKKNNFIVFLNSSRIASILLLEIIISVILSLSALFIFLKIGTEVLEQEIFSIDTYLMNFISGIRSSITTEIMLFFTSLSSSTVFIGVSVFMIFYLYLKRKKDAIIYLSILYSGVIINYLLKILFQRPRPDFPLIHENTYSFPSGHAMNGFVLYATLSYFIFRESKNLKLTILVSILSTILIFCIGISRVYLGVHYPSDIIAGYIAGFLWFISAILFEKTIIFKRLYRSSKK